MISAIKRRSCSTCAWLDFDVFSNSIEILDNGEHFCGLHGRSRVNDLKPLALGENNKECGYILKPELRVVQLNLFS